LRGIHAALPVLCPGGLDAIDAHDRVWAGCHDIEHFADLSPGDRLLIVDASLASRRLLRRQLRPSPHHRQYFSNYLALHHAGNLRPYLVDLPVATRVFVVFGACARVCRPLGAEARVLVVPALLESGSTAVHGHRHHYLIALPMRHRCDDGPRASR
jgi:hypothetical protein